KETGKAAQSGVVCTRGSAGRLGRLERYRRARSVHIAHRRLWVEAVAKKFGSGKKGIHGRLDLWNRRSTRRATARGSGRRVSEVSRREALLEMSRVRRDRHSLPGSEPECPA